MDTFFITLNSITSLVVCIIIGYGCFKAKMLSDGVLSGISNLLVKITLPCATFVALQKPYSHELLIQAIMVFITSTMVFYIGTLTAYVFCKLFKIHIKDKGVYIFALTLPNIVYMGAPVLNSIYGSEVLFYVIIANIPFVIIAFTIGLKMITMGYDENPPLGVKSLLTNPIIIATILGLMCFLFSIKTPEAVNSGLMMVGNMTTPLAMIITGAILAKSPLALFLKDIKLYLFVFVKLIVIPVMIFLVFKSFNIDPVIFGTLVLLSAMPAGTMTVILSAKYNSNDSLSSRFVCASTVLSIISIPLVSILLG